MPSFQPLSKTPQILEIFLFLSSQIYHTTVNYGLVKELSPNRLWQWGLKRKSSITAQQSLVVLISSPRVWEPYIEHQNRGFKPFLSSHFFLFFTIVLKSYDKASADRIASLDFLCGLWNPCQSVELTGVFGSYILQRNQLEC